jgi:hypothetical protein
MTRQSDHHGHPPVWVSVLGAIATLAALLFVSSLPATAADPRCNWDSPTPTGTWVPTDPAPVIDATSGDFDYCTPQVDSFANPYPLTGYPMACEVRNGTTTLDRQTGLAPGEVVTVTGLTLRWRVDSIGIACTNSEGEGAAFVRPTLFPAELPGQPHVPGS